MTGPGAGRGGAGEGPRVIGPGPTRTGAFEFVEGATGDLAFVARGPTPEAVFAAAAEALLAATVEDPERVGGGIRRPVSLAEQELDLLLLRWLDELIWCRDAEQLLVRAGHLTLGRESGAWQLAGELRGEPIGPGHRLRADVKAATAHGLWVGQVGTGWEARVTLDV